MMRMASPGPGNGCRHTIASGRPRSAPSARTSSLNSVRSGSIERELQVVRQPAHVVVGLDVRGAGAAAGLHHVGVERALHQELDVPLGVDLARRRLEDPDELASDDLPLLLRVGHAGERGEEPVGRVDHVQPDAGRRHVVLLDLLGLAGAQQPMVDEDAGELIPDGPVHERRGDRRVDPAGESADHLAVADLRPDRRDLLVDDAGRGPGRRDAGDVVQEALEHPLPVRRVHHLGVELHPGPAAGRSSNAATGARSLRAVTMNPSGATVTQSPWLIQTVCSEGSAASSVPGSITARSVAPNSRWPVCATSPPRARAMAWNP